MMFQTCVQFIAHTEHHCTVSDAVMSIAFYLLFVSDFLFYFRYNIFFSHTILKHKQSIYFFDILNKV